MAGLRLGAGPIRPPGSVACCCQRGCKRCATVKGGCSRAVITSALVLCDSICIKSQTINPGKATTTSRRQRGDSLGLPSTWGLAAIAVQ